MRFDSDVTVFCDMSYTCSGVFCLTKDKHCSFAGFSRAESKRDLQAYWLAAEGIRAEFRDYLSVIFASSNYKTISFVVEAPFPGSFASSGLFLLQGATLSVLRELAAIYPEKVVTVYSLAPSYISSNIRKACNKQDSISVRKNWCAQHIKEMKEAGYVFDDTESQLKSSGADRQTAFGFFWFLSHSDKQLNPFLLS